MVDKSILLAISGVHVAIYSCVCGVSSVECLVALNSSFIFIESRAKAIEFNKRKNHFYSY